MRSCEEVLLVYLGLLFIRSTENLRAVLMTFSTVNTCFTNCFNMIEAMKLIIGLTLILLTPSTSGNNEVCEVHKNSEICYKSGILTRVTSNASVPLDRLHLDFVSGSITTIGRNAFKNVEITDLDISGAIPPKFHGYTASVSLLPDSFAGLSSLKFLSLYHLSISFNNENPLSPLRSLESLNMISSNLTEVPTEMLTSVPYLLNLSLRDNKIGAIRSNSFASLKRLRALNLESNGISHIESDAFNGLSELEYLHLSNNAFPASLGLFKGIKKLHKLYLHRAFRPNESQLEAGMFDGLSELKDLDLSRNKIENIPKGVFENLTSLKKLKLSFNEITTITREAFGRLRLLDLDLSDNRIKVIDTDTFIGLSVSYLIIARNEIVELKPRAFNGLTGGNLYLGGNHLRAIDADDFEGARFGQLDLEGNMIETIANGTLKNVVTDIFRIKSNPIEGGGMRRAEWGLSESVEMY